ncbi:MAG: transposase [Promethearchaeati archaeon SRVP18_Atabeyarchaeia-1]
MRKCLPLNLLKPTGKKRRILRKTYATYLGIVREALCSLGGAKSRAQLHNKTYTRLRAEHNIASQLVIEATSHAWSAGKTASRGVEGCIVRFDSRLFSFRQTERGNPVLALRTSAERIGLPLCRDGAYQRLQAHLFQGWKLTSIIMKRSMRFLVVLSKEMPASQVRRNWLGVDVNSPRIATSTTGPDCSVLKQAYYGMEVATRQFNFEKRRAALQQLRDTSSRSKAGLKLKRLARSQRNYVRTSIWLVANQIVQQAEALGANIAIEKLSHLRKRRGEWSAASRRKVNRTPYGFLRHALRHVAERRGVLLVEVDPRYTSQMCPYCGYTSKANWVGYSYFKCRACGYEANRDRVASLNIALRAAQTQDTSRAHEMGQFPGGSASVSRRVWQGEGFERPRQTTPSCKPTSFSGG